MNYKSTYKHDTLADLVVYSVADDAPFVRLGVCGDKYDASDARDAAAKVADAAFSAGVEAFRDRTRASTAATSCVDAWMYAFGYSRDSTESY
jgi:hypothetical protein